MSRREYGTGSVSQRKDGRWIGRVEAGYTTTGGRRRVTVSAMTEDECRRRLKARLRQINAAGGRVQREDRTTVKGWADTWLPIYRGEVRPTVYATNASHVRKWIVPTLGRVRLTDLTPAHIRTLHRALLDEDKSAYTVGHVHVTLVRMLRAAIIEGHAVPSSLFEVKHPEPADDDREAIPTDDARRIIAHVLPREDRARWAAALLQGMRQGECLGLTWQAVDLEQGTIDVSWQLQRFPYADKADRSKGFIVPSKYQVRHLTGAWHLVRPKTRKGRRIIPLVPWMGTELARAKAAWTPNPWGLVWAGVTAKGEPMPKRATDDREDWTQIQAALGIAHPDGRPYHLHEARHTTATLLMELGIDEAVRKAIMGHSSITTTRLYQHTSQDMSRAALEQVAGVVGLVAVDDPQPPALGS